MKKLLFILILILVLIFSKPLPALTLEQGQSTTFENREITVKFVQQSKVVMEVDGEKNIINQGQTKEINSVRITITDIFYSDPSSVSFNAELTYACGDGTCDDNENYQTCCQDCECPIEEQCTSTNSCIKPECYLDEDCNDHNDLTDDSCSDYKCKHRERNCKAHSECDDDNPETDDFCHRGKCQNLQNWICKTDTDCDSDDPCVLGQCINKDCQYKKIENCKSSESEKKKSESKKEETPPLKFTDDAHPGVFKRFLNWLKNLF